MSLSIEPALQFDQEPWRDACERGSELYKQETYQEAIPFYEAARQQGYNTPAWLAALGYCYFRVGDYDKSIALCQSLTEREPDNAEHFDYLGQSLFYAGRFGEAAVAYSEAVRLGEPDAELLRDLGDARTRCGDYAGAREALEQARSMEPDSPDLFWYLGSVSWGEEKWEEALHHFAKAASLDPQDTYSLIAQGRLLVFLRRPHEAAAAYREALRRNPQSSKAAEGMADIAHLCRLFPLNYLSALRHRFQIEFRAAMADETFAEQDTDFHAYAADTYNRLTGWFGPPSDAAWPTRTEKAPSCRCCRNFLSKEYVVEIMPEYETDDYRFAIVGHEMRHRVLHGRKRNSLYWHMWVQEMLAEMSALRLLRETGRGELADEQERLRLEAEAPMPVRAVTRARRLYWQRIFWGDAYPDGFYSGMMRLGIELEKAVGWDALCRLPACRTWDEWFGLLPNEETRAAARALLEMPEKQRRFRLIPVP